MYPYYIRGYREIDSPCVLYTHLVNDLFPHPTLLSFGSRTISVCTITNTAPRVYPAERKLTAAAQLYLHDRSFRVLLILPEWLIEIASGSFLRLPPSIIRLALHIKFLSHN